MNRCRSNADTNHGIFGLAGSQLAIISIITGVLLRPPG